MIGPLVIILNISWILMQVFWKKNGNGIFKIKYCLMNAIQWTAIIIQVGYMLTRIRVNSFGDVLIKDDSLSGVLASTLLLQLIIALTNTWYIFSKPFKELENSVVFDLKPGTYEFSKNTDWTFSAFGVIRLAAAIKYNDVVIKMPDIFNCSGEEHLKITCIPPKDNESVYTCLKYSIENEEVVKKKFSHHVYKWMAIINLILITLTFIFIPEDVYFIEGTIEHDIFGLLCVGILGGWVSIITEGISNKNPIKWFSRFIVVMYPLGLITYIIDAGGLEAFVSVYMGMLGF